MKQPSDLTVATNSGDGELFAAEQVLLCSDPTTGLRAIVVVDDTTCGKGLGGVRYYSYPDDAAALAECRRLARGMTFKHAAAELPYGGAKSVIVETTDRPVDRTTLMHAFGRMVAPLGEVYVPAVDMGTTPEDIAEIGRYVADVECDDEDPAPMTALGVHAGIQAAVAHVDGREGLDGVRVAIQGVGHVGTALARLLAEDGAELLLTDIDEGRARRLAAEVGGTVIDNDSFAATDCDVLAPCAIGRTVSAESVPRLRCRVVAGAANDVLADPSCASVLRERGIVYVPDFLINAGGVVLLHAKRQRLTQQDAIEAIERIGPRVANILGQAHATDTTPLAVAQEIVRGRLEKEARDSA